MMYKTKEIKKENHSLLGLLIKKLCIKKTEKHKFLLLSATGD